MEGLRPEKLEDTRFYKQKTEDSLIRDNLESDVEEIELPYLTPENLKTIFRLHEFKNNFTEQLSDDEVISFMQRIHDFEEKLKEKAESGELKYGDNVIRANDLRKFALYDILIGRNLSPESTWLDLEDGLIENFMLNGFRETE